MLKIGLTGGIGTGKSSVSALFKKWGAYIFDADSVAKSILDTNGTAQRSEEHTSELQSRTNLVCRLLLEKKKKQNNRASIKTTTTKKIDAQAK